MMKPNNFDGAKFAAKYNLTLEEFYDDGKGNIICSALPNLTNEDLLNCIADPPSPELIFDKPIKAPDFIVATPPIKDDPLEALADAIAEMEKGEGNPKSLALITLSLAKYLKQAQKDIEDLQKKIK